MTGSLVVAGTGIELAGQITVAAQAHIEQADKVFFVVSDAGTAQWIRQLNPTAESLRVDGVVADTRREKYEEMVERLVDAVRAGDRVCAVFCGHPGVLCDPGHLAIQRVREGGYPTKLLPGVSAIDCLFADLGTDPAETGWQCFDATDFLICKRISDPCSALILWQVGMVGNPYYESYEAHGLSMLRQVLQESYAVDHEVVVYEAALYPGCDPLMERVPLSQLEDAPLSANSLLYVPPLQRATPDPVREVQLFKSLLE